MTKIHTVKSGNYKSMYSINKLPPFKGTSLKGLPHYVQQDDYSCGFIAALTVVHYFRPLIEPKKVLEAVRCVRNVGTSREKVINGLDRFGIDAEYREDMTVSDLLSLIRSGIPVITTVWPDGWPMDHWVTVEGICENHQVHLTNHYPMSLRDFRREWIECWGPSWDTGAGLICSLR